MQRAGGRRMRGAPFDLARDRCCGFACCSWRPEHVLLFNMHHIVADGWSLGVLVRELGALYAASCSGEAAQLPPLPCSTPTTRAWQREWLHGRGAGAAAGLLAGALGGRAAAAGAAGRSCRDRRCRAIAARGCAVGSPPGWWRG